MYSNFKTYLILFGGRFCPIHLGHLRQAGRRPLWRHRLLPPLLGSPCVAPIPAVPEGSASRGARAERRTVEKNYRGWPVFGAALCDVVRVPALYLHRQLHRPVCLQPLFSLALERVILKSKPKPTAICGCAIALVGSVIIGFGDFQVSGMSLLGDVLAFLAAGSSPATSSSANRPAGGLRRHLLRPELSRQRRRLGRVYHTPGKSLCGLHRRNLAGFSRPGAAVHHRRTVRIQPPAQKTPRLSSDHEHPRRTHRHLHPSLPVPPRVHLPTAIGGHRGHHRRPEHLFHSAGAESGLLKKKNDYTMQSYDVVVFWGD